jgi:hypothetical protein
MGPALDRQAGRWYWTLIAAFEKPDFGGQIDVFDDAAKAGDIE